MDSGNSGSLQSSSGGGDEDYDPRGEFLSPFFNPSAGSISNLQQQSLPDRHQTHPRPTLFDPPPHNLQPFSQSQTNPNTNPLYNPDLVWSRDLIRSQTNLTEKTTISQSLLGGPSHVQFSSSPSMQQSDQTNIAKNPRKRTRASRRAPTTVLTTDTSNFRQMVQEFTGIPTAPFSASPYSRRLDLFGTTAMKSGNLDTLGHLFPSRPLTQNVHQIAPYGTNYIGTTTNNTNSIGGISGNLSSSTNYQIPSDIGFQKQSQNLLNMQNQILTFQSLIQSPHHPAANATIFGTKSQGGSSIHSVDQFGLSHENVNMNLGGFTGHGTSDGV